MPLQTPNNSGSRTPCCKLSEFSKDSQLPMSTLKDRICKSPLPEPEFLKYRGGGKSSIKMYSVAKLKKWLNDWNKEHEHR